MRKRWILLALLLVSLCQASAIESLDIQIDLIEKDITPEDPLRFQVTVFRLGEMREDIYFQYFIGQNDNLRFIKSESVAVEKIASFFRTIELPESVKIGQNSLLVKASFQDAESNAKANFNLIKSPDYLELPKHYVTYFLLLTLLIAIAFIFLLVRDYRLAYKLIKLDQKIEEKDIVR